jgi:hypothetical protein
MIVYTGGPASRQYQLVKRAITKRNYIARFGEPTVDEDGCIHYTKTGPKPPTPAGYELVPDEDWKFRPVWPSCAHRILRVIHLEDGSLHVEGLCNKPAADKLPHYALSVDDCSKCPHRQPISD